MRRVSAADLREQLAKLADEPLGNVQKSLHPDMQLFKDLDALALAKSVSGPEALRLAFAVGEHRGASNPYC